MHFCVHSCSDTLTLILWMQQQGLSSCDRHWDNRCFLEAVPAASPVLTYHVMGYIGLHKSVCLYTQVCVCLSVGLCKGCVTAYDSRKSIHNCTLVIKLNLLCRNIINVPCHNNRITVFSIVLLFLSCLLDCFIQLYLCIKIRLSSQMLACYRADHAYSSLLMNTVRRTRFPRIPTDVIWPSHLTSWPMSHRQCYFTPHAVKG